MHLPVNNATPFTSLESPVVIFNPYSLSLWQLRTEFKKQMSKEKTWSKRIKCTASSSFTNSEIKPLKEKKKSIVYISVTGKCCASRMFLFWELCPLFCLMCQCWQPRAVSFCTTVHLPFCPHRHHWWADTGTRSVCFEFQEHQPHPPYMLKFSLWSTLFQWRRAGEMRWNVRRKM